jgi:hypothetical protein
MQEVPLLINPTMALVVAKIRNGKLTANPMSMPVFVTGNRTGIIGENDQIETARRIVELRLDSDI